MSPYIGHLSIDCLALVLHYVSGDDVVALLSTGDRVLRRKVAFSVRDLVFKERSPGSIFPFAVFGLPKLRSLALREKLGWTKFLNMSDREAHALIRGSKSLEKIELDFRNCFGLFCSHSEPPKPHLPIRERFPSLTTLILKNITTVLQIGSLCGELPDSITHLELTHPAGSQYAMKLTSIADLPRGLTFLKLGAFVDEPEDEHFDFSKILPPALQHLQVRLSGMGLLDHLPSTLEYFDCTVVSDASIHYWPVSKCPPKIVYLELFLASEWVIEFDAPFPETLETFHTFGATFPHGIPSSALPKGLKQLDEEILGMLVDGHTLVDRYHSLISKFPNYTNVVIDNLVPIHTLPKCLESLKCYDLASIPSSLPATLKALSMVGVPIPIEDIANIPRTLRRLAVRPPAPAGSISFQPWSALEISHLVPISLKTLSIEVNYVLDLASLAPISKMRTLATIAFGSIPPDGRDALPSWLPKCIPSKLVDLKLTFATSLSEKAADDAPEISDDFLRLCHLADAVPHLHGLEFDYGTNNPLVLDRSLSTLPRNLKRLKISSHSVSLEHDALRRLPRSITYLRIFLTQSKRFKLSNNHFEGAPPSLAFLDVSFPIIGATLDVEVFKLFPPYLYNVLLCASAPNKARQGSEEVRNAQKLNAALSQTNRERQLSSPHFHGFIPDLLRKGA